MAAIEIKVIEVLSAKPVKLKKEEARLKTLKYAPRYIPNFDLGFTLRDSLECRNGTKIMDNIGSKRAKLIWYLTE